MSLSTGCTDNGSTQGTLGWELGRVIGEELPGQSDRGADVSLWSGKWWSDSGGIRDGLPGTNGRGDIG